MPGAQALKCYVMQASTFDRSKPQEKRDCDGGTEGGGGEGGKGLRLPAVVGAKVLIADVKERHEFASNVASSCSHGVSNPLNQTLHGMAQHNSSRVSIACL